MSFTACLQGLWLVHVIGDYLYSNLVLLALCQTGRGSYAPSASAPRSLLCLNDTAGDIFPHTKSRKDAAAVISLQRMPRMCLNRLEHLCIV